MAETEYASTGEGQADARAKATSGEDGPGGLPADYWTRIAENGAAMRERNDMVAAAVQSATKIGDAFNADVISRCSSWIPDNIRSQQALDRHLDQVEINLDFQRQMNRSTDLQLARAHELVVELEGLTPDRNATFASGNPRSATEQAAWVNHVKVVADGHRAKSVEGAQAVTDANTKLGEFGRGTSPTVSRGPETSRDFGFVGRITQPDGSPSKKDYLVTRWAEPGANRVQVQALETTVQTGRSWKRPGTMIKAADSFPVDCDRLVSADDDTWAKFASLHETTLRTERTVLLQSSADEVDHELMEFRIYNARKSGHPFTGIRGDQYYYPGRR